MSMTIVRPMTTQDLAFADGVRAAAGWNQTRTDWLRFLTIAPDGCFVAERGGVPVGTATAVSYGPPLGWIGMLLVHPEHRRSGIGSALLRHCLEHFAAREVRCVKLDATPLGQPLYAQLGFQPETGLTRWEVAAAPLAGVTGEASIPEEAALREIIALDARSFGVARPVLLRELLGAAFRVEARRSDADGTVDGFGLLREGSRAFYLGPIAADHPFVATGVIQTLLSAVAGRPVFWDVPDANLEAAALAPRLGFKPQRRLVRMFRGDNRVAPELRMQFGIVDPAVG